jgi:hypothetical protein
MIARVFVCLIAFALVPSVFAQSGVEVSGGYAFLRQRFNIQSHGFVGSVAKNLNGWLGIKGEVGGSYRNEFNFLVGEEYRTGLYSFLAGPQFSAGLNTRFTPWAHFLAGAARHNISSAFFPNGVASGEPPILRKLHETDFAIQPGGGFDFWLSPRVGVRIGADYRRTFRDNVIDTNSGRAHAGIVFKIGSE